MTYYRKPILRAALIATMLALGAATGFSQPSNQIQSIRGQFRDAAIDVERGQFFVAVYERNSLWRIDPATGDVATRIQVGKGPVALAMDGHLLACVNRLDNSVTVIRLGDMSVIDTVTVGDGPSAIAALGQGRFVVSNTFSDSLSVIDTRGTVSATSVSGTVAVPVDVAVTSAHLVAVSRADGRLHCYDRSTLSPTKTIVLPDNGSHIAAGPGDTVYVLGQKAIHHLDIATGTVGEVAQIAASDLDFDGETLHVIAEASYETFRADLTPVATLSLSESATTIAAREGIVAFLNPKAQILQTRNLNTLQPNVIAQAPEEAPAPTPVSDDTAMVIVEATPVEETAAAPVAPEPEPPVVEEDNTPIPMAEATPAETVAEETPTATPKAVEETRPVSDADVTMAPGPKAVPSSGVHKNPINTGGVRAPSPVRPSASPLQRLSRKTITEALVRPTEFGSTEGGFVAPDLTKPLDSMKFSNSKGSLTSTEKSYENLRAEFGDLTLQADTFKHSQKPVQVHAEGNVIITQQSSSITADSINYTLEGAEAETKMTEPLLEGAEAAGGSTMDQGRLTLENAHIIEPTREMTADYLDYDFQTGKGELTNAKGQAGIYYFSAAKLHLHGPQSLSGDDVWVTTCDHPSPHYKIRLSDVEMVDGQPVAGSNARLQLGKTDTPLYLPKWRRGGVGGSPWNVDFDSGRQAETGYYLNVGQQYEVNPDVTLGPRLFVTEKEGVGFGADLGYDFMENPASRLYRTKGEVHGLYTTKDRGFIHGYHRYEYSDDLVVRAQVEHWSDEDFYKDFYYDIYRNRSRPRSFANVTYRKENYIATGTVRMQTHGWFAETEQAPEATFHLLERKIAENLYFSFDTVNGYYNREPSGVDGARTVNTARVSYSWDPHPALAVTPFVQFDTSIYSRDRLDSGATGRFGATAGVTAQSRLSRTYGGRWGFSAFKHVVLPSLTYSFRPKTNLDAPEIPQFDPLDSDFGRSRVELKLDNVFYGRDAKTGDVWQVGRISLYQGNDFWNETRQTEDYEIEIDVRPRPWWGMQLAGERQSTSDEDSSLSRFSLARNYPRFYEAVIGDIFGAANAQDFSGRFGDYNRILSQLYYDDAPRGGKFSGRVGFAYTETQSQVFNREALYGVGYQISDKWGFGFEHTYDLEDNDLRSQTYELRRSLHCWETAIRFRDRESGFDINFEFNIKAFPGSSLKF